MSRQCNVDFRWRNGYCKRRNQVHSDIGCNINPLTNEKHTRNWCKDHKEDCDWIKGKCQKNGI